MAFTPVQRGTTYVNMEPLLVDQIQLRLPYLLAWSSKVSRIWCCQPPWASSPLCVSYLRALF